MCGWPVVNTPPAQDGAPWPWIEENGVSEAEAERYNEETIAVYEVLRRWFYGMENGLAQHWQPDPDYVRPSGKPLTEQQVDRVIAVALDEWFNNSANRGYALNTRQVWHDAGPDFARLAAPQRLALVQELCTVLEAKPAVKS